MLDWYFQEVRKKRRKSIIFWLFVAIFAVFLYLFFNGKYISINISSFKNLSQTGGQILSGNLSESQKNDNSFISFHSFGIVNIKIFPKDASIFLNETPYINDSKPQIDYGNYTLFADAYGYMSGSMDFSINDKKNFYINDITLIKNPEYKKFVQIDDARIIKIAENSWIGYTGSGMTLYKNSFGTGELIHKKHLTSLGEGKFLSGSSIVEYNTTSKEWKAENSAIINNFVKKCENVTFQFGVYFCENEQKIMTPSGKIFDEITDFGNNFIVQKENIFLGKISEDGMKKFSLTESQIENKNIGKNFIEIEWNWLYIDENGKFRNIETWLLYEWSEKLPNFENVDFISKIGDNTVFIGNTLSGKTLAISHPQKPEIKYIPFPEIPLNDVKIYEQHKNFFIKTQNAILLLYNDGNEIRWVVDGKILAVWEDFALYEKDSEIWIANWKDENFIKK